MTVTLAALGLARGILRVASPLSTACGGRRDIGYARPATMRMSYPCLGEVRGGPFVVRIVERRHTRLGQRMEW